MRIGVVLSVLWMVGATGYHALDEARKHGEYANAMYNWRATCIGENAKRRFNNEPEQACATEEAVRAAYNYELPWLPILVLPTIYLVLAWVLIGITYGSARWIRNGFKV
jgi:hypothetical protein